MALLGSTLIFLGAAVVAVPVFKRLKLGAILGYLVAGAIIGPSLLNLISDPVTILHMAEMGVVLLLFLIGIELEPEKLWRMKSAISLTGGGQLAISSLLIFICVYFAIGNWNSSLVIALALALSSTAFAIQLMNEHRILNSPPGQQAFGILLMQDLAVIPILLLVDAMASSSAAEGPHWYVGVGAVGVVLIAGKYLINPFLRLMSNYGSSEVMTASALLIVLATALGMESAGLSMGMGAFVAGVLLANSSFRHQLEMEIEPFKGLLLGLFFISIGMNLDLLLLVEMPLLIISAALALVVIKTLVIWGLLKLAKQTSRDAMRIGLMLSQGGEFAFVVMTQAAGNGLVDPLLANQITLIVGVSMAFTAPLVIIHSQFFSSSNCPKVYDSASDTDEPSVIIAGFGRFGQMTGRILAANNIAFTALDNDAEHIAFVNQFGSKVFYGDASRLDLLKIAGIEHAKTLLVAVDNEEQGLKIAELVHEHYPDVRLVARAHNRFSVELYEAQGVDAVVREVRSGGLEAAELVLREIGYSQVEASNLVRIFERHDEDMLTQAPARSEGMDDYLAHNLSSREQLASLFEQDRKEIKD
ncbi:monovalent cation:proton antiporter-2 (CPA2) family protein [Marinobacter alexandrii]|uniref:monovalent cation:proton antiporter-2 (CPA2) family protein n=1 Tax=Marinobacter alexandrii TaxID=2570351 RepID=UPI003297E884